MRRKTWGVAYLTTYRPTDLPTYVFWLLSAARRKKEERRERREKRREGPSEEIKAELQQFETRMEDDPSILHVNEMLRQHIAKCNDRGCTDLAPIFNQENDWRADTHRCKIISDALQACDDTRKHTQCPVGKEMNKLVQSLVEKETKEANAAADQFRAAVAQDSSVAQVNKLLRQHADLCNRGCSHLAPICKDQASNWSSNTHRCEIVGQCAPCQVGKTMNIVVRNLLMEDEQNALVELEFAQRR